MTFWIDYWEELAIGITLNLKASAQQQKQQTEETAYRQGEKSLSDTYLSRD
jgi:hypothetical protein